MEAKWFSDRDLGVDAAVGVWVDFSLSCYQGLD